MHKALRPLLFLLAVSVSAQATDSSPRSAESVIAEITRLTQVEWPEAVVRGDAGWFDRHYAEGARIISQGEITTKEQALESIRPSPEPGNRGKLEEFRVSVFDDVAVATYEIHVSGTDDVRPVHRTVRHTEVWVFLEERWQLAVLHADPLPLAPCGPMDLPPEDLGESGAGKSHPLGE